VLLTHVDVEQAQVHSATSKRGAVCGCGGGGLRLEQNPRPESNASSSSSSHSQPRFTATCAQPHVPRCRKAKNDMCCAYLSTHAVPSAA
jgi:hypothetical protein